MEHQRRAARIHDDGEFGARFPAVDGVGAGVVAAAESADDDAVDDGCVRIELVRLAEQREQVGVEAVPDAGLLPGAEAAVGGAARAAEFVGHVLPAVAGGEDEPDDPHDDAVGDAGPTAERADGLFGRQVVLDDVIERVGHVGGGHGRTPER